MEVERKHHTPQLSSWIKRSALLHAIVIIILFLWYLQQQVVSILNKDHVKDQVQTQSALDKKKLMNLRDPATTYTLVPGRKAVTDQTPSASKTPEKTEEIKPEVVKQPFETTQTKPLPIELPDIKSSKILKKAEKKIFDKPKQLSSLEKLEQSLRKPSIQDQIQEEQPEQKVDPSKEEKDPTIAKKKVSLQDLKLGFSKFWNDEGNNDVLRQKGNSNQPPDAQALKAITYKQQVARAMVAAVQDHPLFNQAQRKPFSKTSFSLTIDRDGTNLHSQLLQSCGNSLLDKIVMESVQNIKLYPPIPKHIPDNPLSCNWNFIHT